MENRKDYRIIKDKEGFKVQKCITDYAHGTLVKFWETIGNNHKAIPNATEYTNFWGKKVKHINGYDVTQDDIIFETKHAAFEWITEHSFEVVS